MNIGDIVDNFVVERDSLPSDIQLLKKATLNWLIWAKTALSGATKLTKANYCGIVLWSSYHFATQVYTDCKIVAEVLIFMEIYGMVFKCSHR